MKALIFTEGGKRIGFGHITRCLALKTAFSLQGVQVSLIVHGDDSVRKQYHCQIDASFDWLSQNARTRKLLAGASIVVVDSYLAPIDFYETVSATVPTPVFLDDFSRLRYPFGFVVNGAVNAEKIRYPANYGKRCLLGSRYALLRKDFWQVPRKKTRKEIRNVLVTFGGMNRTVFIEKMIACLQPQFGDWHFHVVVAPSFRQTCLSNKKVSFYSGLSASQMKALMARCDIAISGGGQTTNELAACGVPSVGICFAKNQRLNIRGWQQHGFLKYAGHFNNPSVFRALGTKLRCLTFKSRFNMGRIGQRLIDGLGPMRIAREIMGMGLSLQDVQIGDRKKIYEWSNSSRARAVSFNANPIKWPEHCRWFRAKLKDPGCLFFKIMRFDRPIGQVRFDRSGKYARISISLDERYRGKGLGGPAISLATQRVFTTVPGIRFVDAFIKKDNVTSQRTFLKAGFRFVGEETIRDQIAHHFCKGKYEKISVS